MNLIIIVDDSKFHYFAHLKIFFYYFFKQNIKNLIFKLEMH